VRYRPSYNDEAKHALRSASGFYRQRSRRTIEELSADPRPFNAEAMREPGFYKIRFDRWRLIYRVRDNLGEVRILRVRAKTGPETYQGLDNRD
jgi:mRNA-degrading endonuclease RelE of RelBE toxin-antitoxin system